jgi:hypothetical protein
MRRILIGCWLVVTAALADMGSIPLQRDVTVYEPEQDALIAWSGQEEVLLLATTLRASAPTKVLEIMPLPSRPTVTAGEHRSFVLANNLMKWKTARAEIPANVDPFAAASPAPAGRVAEMKHIGAHDLSITEAVSEEGFVTWARDYLKKHGAPDAVIPDAFGKVVADYLRDGFTWFIFDIVDLTPTAVKKDVLRIRFKTDHLYFPLRITRSEKGPTTVSLMIMTTSRIDPPQFVGWPRDKIKMTTPIVSLNAEELQSIDASLWDVLQRPEAAILRTWSIQGALDAFDRDLLIAGTTKKQP